ncbi:HEAT repeat domain-containing protein [Nocardia sp. XZ_19_369]|uniref:NACHT domain-containing protein n=1 Tax=Nocardia sp. XZ_19_369 TaxID=2769487 RepID=UPI00188FAEA0|nr:HEAT repeat domain-containing protein [Nocardia sp. XZ_19_369]
MSQGARHPRAEFKQQLGELYRDAGSPSFKALERKAALNQHRLSDATLSGWINGGSTPRQWTSSVEWLIDSLLRQTQSSNGRYPRSVLEWKRQYSGSSGKTSKRPDSGSELSHWCAREEARHLRSLAQLPYLPLSRDPVELDVGAVTRLQVRRRSESSDDADETSIGRHRTTGSALSYADLTSLHRKVVLLGDPGMGKSWVLATHAIRLLRTARKLLEDRAFDPELLELPILLRCDVLAVESERPETPNFEAAAATILTRRDTAMTLALSRWLRHYCHTSQHAVFLLDALDETSEEQRFAVTRTVNSLSNLEAQVVVACRRSGYHTGVLPFAERVEAELLPLDNLGAYIDGWKLPPDRRRQLDERLGNHAIGQMARVPLLLAFLCHLSADFNESLPETRAALYGRILRRFLRQEHRVEGPRFRSCLSHNPIVREQELLSLLRPLAYAIATAPAGWHDRISADTLEVLLESLPRLGGLSVPETLHMLSVESGILVPDGDIRYGRTQPYLFLHRTFAEFLVAQHLAREPHLIKDCRRSHLHLRPEWHETWLLTAGLVPEPTLRALTGGVSDPMHIALSTAAAAVAELEPEQRADNRHLIGVIIDTASALLDDPSVHSQVRRLAAEALGRVGDPASVDVLIRALGHFDEDYAVNSAATEALAQIGGPVVLASMSNVLADTNFAVRISACVILGRIADPAALPLLYIALQDTEAIVREKAMEALDEIGDPGVDTVMDAAMTDPDWDVRGFATNRNIREGRIPHTIHDLQNIVRGDFAYASAEAVGLLFEIGGAAALNSLLSDTDMETRRTAVIGLRSVTDPAAVDMLDAAMSDPSIGVREAAMHALKEIGGERAISVLGRAVHDPNPRVRGEAWVLLAYVKDTEVASLVSGGLPVLIAALTGPNLNGRWGACRLLGTVRESVAIAALTMAVTDPDRAVAKAAWEGLGKVGGPTIIEMLKDAACNGPDSIQIDVGRALGMAGEYAAAAAALRRVVPDEDNLREYLSDAASVAQLLDTKAIVDVIDRWIAQGVEPFIEAAADLAFEHFNGMTVQGDDRPQLLELLDRVTRAADGRLLVPAPNDDRTPDTKG